MGEIRERDELGEMGVLGSKNERFRRVKEGYMEVSVVKQRRWLENGGDRRPVSTTQSPPMSLPSIGAIVQNKFITGPSLIYIHITGVWRC